MASHTTVRRSQEWGETMGVKSRIRRLEDRFGCSECCLKSEAIHVVYPEEGNHALELEHCPKCSRPLGYILTVLYEGEGGA
jgi:hypothetical protein